MSKRQYETARDLAWRMLLECGIEELPVRPSEVCRHYGWILADYRSGAGAIQALGLEGLMEQTDGFCTVTANHTYESFRLAIIRATVALPLPGWLQALLWGR